MYIHNYNALLVAMNQSAKGVHVSCKSVNNHSDTYMHAALQV